MTGVFEVFGILCTALLGFVFFGGLILTAYIAWCAIYLIFLAILGRF